MMELETGVTAGILHEISRQEALFEELTKWRLDQEADNWAVPESAN